MGITHTTTCLILLGFVCPLIVSAMVYNVGDQQGWGPGNDYTLWVKGKTFFRGDILVFRYGEGYSVEEVIEEKFKTCDPTHAIFSSLNGNTSIPLTFPGLHYFIGGAFNECPFGMNLTLSVL